MKKRQSPDFRSPEVGISANSYYEFSLFYKTSTGNNFALTQGRDTLIVIMNIPRCLS